MRLDDTARDKQPQSDALDAGRCRFGPEEAIGVPLTQLEFGVMRYLSDHTGKLATRIVLESEVWRYDHHGGTTVVDTVVKSLRKKLASRAARIVTAHRNLRSRRFTK